MPATSGSSRSRQNVEPRLPAMTAPAAAAAPPIGGIGSVHWMIANSPPPADVYTGSNMNVIVPDVAFAAGASPRAPSASAPSPRKDRLHKVPLMVLPIRAGHGPLLRPTAHAVP